MDIELTIQQKEALRKINNWYYNESKQIFCLSGYAGTGKSTLISVLHDALYLDKSKVAVATFTGKAASVLVSKNIDQARTIHSLIYSPRQDPKTKKLIFEKKSYQDINSWYDLIIIDECSMLGAWLLSDLKSYGVKILLVGDIAQLPPIETSNIGSAYKYLENPDYQLTEIHRQAWDSPIIKLANLVRQKKKLSEFESEDVIVKKKNKCTEEDLLTYSQILCSYNNTRIQMNTILRNLKGKSSIYPQEGERLICLQNNYNVYSENVFLANGLIGEATNIRDYRSKSYLDFTPDGFNYDCFMPDITYCKEYFNPTASKNLQDHEYEKLKKKGTAFYDFGYAITVHKSQGSQFGSVLVYDEPMGRSNPHEKILYTAITRAERKLLILID